MNTPIRQRRLFASGASRLSANSARFYKELGRRLALEENLVVVTGGLEKRFDDPESKTADWTIVEGMVEQLGSAPDDRIETFLPGRQHDWNSLVRFRRGKIRELTNRSAPSRRFSMVHSSDVVLSIEGDLGTRSVLDMALAIERPVLPLPFGGGVSREIWNSERDEIARWFHLTDAEIAEFEQLQLNALDEPQLTAWAHRVHVCLMRGFPQSCFVIMRFHKESDPVFDQAIEPALHACGFSAWRTDRTVTTGDIVEAIRNGINHCHFVIADTTGDRPNVMYELGLAHAIDKNVLLLRRKNPDGSPPDLPFDFTTNKCLEYNDNMKELQSRLEIAIRAISGKSRA